MLNRIRAGLKWRARALFEGIITLMAYIFKESACFFYCPVCQRKVRKFSPLPAYYKKMSLTHGATFEPDLAETCNVNAYSCPNCGASDRSRLYALYIKKLFADNLKRSSWVMLHFAPCKALQRFIEDNVGKEPVQRSCITSDLMMEGVDVKADICAMPEFEDQSVDFFICSHILEHVIDDCVAMCELHRILRAGGSGIVMAPLRLDIQEIDEDPTVTDIGERWRRFGQNDHVRKYSKAGFVGRLESAGFRVEQLGVKFFGRKIFKRSGISSKSVLYVVHRAS